MIASEIDGITRFAAPAKLFAYAGVVPTTEEAEGNSGGLVDGRAPRSSGRVYHGRLLWLCNKWLRWALVEASWSAIQCSGYFGGLYRAARGRGKNKNGAITIVAHRLGQIIWLLLTEKRPYTETLPDRSEPQMTVAAGRKPARHAPRR